MKKPSLLIIFLTVFIDLIGFGIVLPLLPIFAKNFNATGFTIGALMASYSAMQFLFAPIWGRLSDRIGRRPVLLVSVAGSALSYVVFAVGCGMEGNAALVLLFASRILAGICGANVTVAQAYIADITPPENRSKKMGLIGVAFGLGFIFGPVISGISLKTLGITGPGWIAAGLCAANFLFALARLPESWQPSSSGQVEQRPHLDQFMHTLRTPRIGLLVVLFFLGTFVFSAFETTLGLLVSRNFDLNVINEHGVAIYDAKIVYLYAYCGILGAFVQGGMIGRLVKKYGEPAIISISFLLVALSMGPMPYISLGHFGWAGLLVLLAILAIGTSLARAPIFGLLSNLSLATEQGVNIGVAQSAGSLARIFGPIFAATLLETHVALPYLSCAVISLLTCLVAWKRLGLPKSSSSST